MSTSHPVRPGGKPGPSGTSSCTDDDCTSGRRNRYYVGKRLTPDSFRVEQEYAIERRRLLNRALYGWGVVYGLAVGIAKSDAGCGGCNGPAESALQIGPGLALDRNGRELVQTDTLRLVRADLLTLDTHGKRIDATTAADPAAACNDTSSGKVCWLLQAHYAEVALGPVQVSDPCHCDRTQWDQLCETVRYSLVRIDCAQCCRGEPCELDCACASGGCCEPKEKVEETATERGHDVRTPRGGCRCLCDYLIHLDLPATPSALCEIEDGVRVDLANGIPLACVTLHQDECKRWVFDADIEVCGPRRLVKRNDLLFDLIRGCDLTRISAISWPQWHRAHDPVPWKAFETFFGKEDPVGRCTTGFWVEFSRPVRKATLRPDCFALTLVLPEDEGGWGTVMRAPIVHVEATGDPGDPAGLVRRATLVVDAAWASDAIHGRKTAFYRHETWVEIEVRGDFILDCNGQPVDANAHGLVPAPTGNGTPGGTFLSTFRLRMKPYESASKTSEA